MPRGKPKSLFPHLYGKKKQAQLQSDVASIVKESNGSGRLPRLFPTIQTTVADRLVLKLTMPDGTLLATLHVSQQGLTLYLPNKKLRDNKPITFAKAAQLFDMFADE